MPLFDSSIDLIRIIKQSLATVFDQLKHIKNWTHSNKENLTFPKQMNSIDCGPFICLFARQFGLSMSTDFSQKHINEFRNHMRHEIMNYELSDFIINDQ